MPSQYYYRIWTPEGKFLGVVRTEFYHLGNVLERANLYDLVKSTFPNEYIPISKYFTCIEILSGILTIDEVIRG